MNTSPPEVLLLGRAPEVLETLVQELTALGVSVRGSTDAEHAAETFDALDLDVIVFGSALVGPASENLRRAFAGRNPDVRFVDAFAPVAVRQILAAINGKEPARRYANGFKATEVGADLLVRARILAPCTVKTEIYRALGAPPPMVQLLAQSGETVGPSRSASRQNAGRTPTC